jgi:hypothetical protein
MGDRAARPLNRVAASTVPQELRHLRRLRRIRDDDLRSQFALCSSIVLIIRGDTSSSDR